MDQLKVLRLYLAVRLHFTNKKYDIFQYKAAVKNCNDLTLGKSIQRKRLIERLAKRFSTPGEVIGYLFPQWLYSDGSSLYDIIDSEDNYIRWQKFRTAPSYFVISECANYELSELFEGEVPKIIHLIMNGEISIETGVALQKIYGYLDDRDYFIFNRICGKIIKSVGFINIDKEKIAMELDYAKA